MAAYGAAVRASSSSPQSEAFRSKSAADAAGTDGRQDRIDMERVTGFEPVSGPWRGPILAARRYPHGASGENRTLLASLEGWNSTNKSHSLEIHITYIQLSKNTLRRQRVDG